jgi:hypothetical protein
VSYRIEHQKTTIVVQSIDVDAEQLGYFHGRSYYELDAENFAAVLRLDDTPGLPPYTELIDLSRIVHRDYPELRDIALAQAVAHLSRRAIGDPIAALGGRIVDDLPWLRANPELFHGYAFGTLRQLGAWASTTATFVEWLEHPDLVDAVHALEALSAASKTCQFKLARIVAGRDGELDELFAKMSESRAQAYESLVSVYAG